MIAACHVRGIKLFNHASPENKKKKKKMVRTTGSTCLSLKMLASLTVRQSEVSQMFPDSVCSLLVCNLFSHALSVAGSQVRFLIHNEHGRG